MQPRLISVMKDQFTRMCFPHKRPGIKAVLGSKISLQGQDLLPTLLLQRKTLRPTGHWVSDKPVQQVWAEIQGRHLHFNWPIQQVKTTWRWNSNCSHWMLLHQEEQRYGEWIMVSV